MNRGIITVFSVAASFASAAVSVTVRGTTPTQAILSYTLSAATGSACLVEVSEAPGFSPVVHDTDATLYSGSNLDSRSGSITNGTYHVFVAGTRGAAQAGIDGRQYSRALAASTVHYFRINNDGACDRGGAVSGSFTTAPIPNGRLYNDPIPSNGNGAAWPGFYGSSRTSVVDPQTGARIVALNVPGENVDVSTSAQGFAASFDTTGTWAHPANAATGATPAATFSNSNQAPLALDVNVTALTNSWINGNSGARASYEGINGDSLDYLQVNITGFGAGSTAAARQINVCLSLAGGGNRCASPMVTDTLPPASGTVSAGGHTPGMIDWGASFSGLDPVLAGQHAGTVTRSGATLTWASGSAFRPQTWMAGTQITLTGGCTGTYSLAAPPTQPFGSLTLSAAPTCTSGAINYTVTPLTAIIYKATNSTDQITISNVTLDYQTSFGQGIGSSAMQDGNMGCGPAAVPGVVPPGYICGSSEGYYLVQASVPAVTYLGRWLVPYDIPAGTSHPATDCAPMGFSLLSPLTIWCFVQSFGGGQTNGETYLFSVSFSAANFNAVPGGTILPVCTGSNQPCVTVSNPVGGSTLEAQFAASGFAAASACCWHSFTQILPLMGGQLGDGNIQLQAWTAGLQGLMGIFAVYNPNTATFLAARDSWSYYPVTYSGVHSVQLRRGTHFGLPLAWPGHGSAGGAIGPLSGTDAYAGFGPYRMKTTSTMSSVSCPTQLGGSLIPASLWPGGSQDTGTNCYQFTVDGGMCDPSPWATTITVSGTSATNAVSTTGTIYRSWVGKPIIISGNTYTITSWVDASDFTVTPNLITSPSGVIATFEGEAPDSGTHCGHAGDYFLRNSTPGDIVFATTGTGYADFLSSTGTSEAFMVLRNTSGTIVAQGRYDGGSHSAWSSGTYLYSDSGAQIGETEVSWDFPWDYVNDPTGSLGKVSFDNNPPQGHANIADWGTMGYVDSNPPCPPVVQWDGNTQVECLQGRFGLNATYTTSPIQQIAYAPAYSGQTGSGLANAQDLHPGSSYPGPPAPITVDGRVWNGDTNRPATGTVVSGGVQRFSASQRGCATAAQCILLEQILPLQVNCGQAPGLNQSGPSSSITTSSPVGAFATVVTAGEATPGSQPGDLVINCPGSEGASYGAYIDNGGDHIDVGAYFAGPWMHGIVREGFFSVSPKGEHIQWMGHNLMRPRLFSPFFNVRGTPDGLGIISEIPGLDGVRTMDALTTAPTFSRSDSVNGADFTPVVLQVSTPAGLGVTNAMVEFGYGDNGNPSSGPFCTPRQEICVKGNQTGNTYHFETSQSGAYSGQPCSNGCSVTVPAISGRTLYYRIKYLNGTTVQFATPLEVIAVP